MKLPAFLLALLTALLPAAALIRGPELAAFFQTNSIWQILGWALVGSAICASLLALLFLDAIMSRSRITIRADNNGKIKRIGNASRAEEGAA